MIFGPPTQSASTSTLNTSSNIIWALISGKTPNLPAEGLALWVDVRDVAEAHIRVLDKEGMAGRRVLMSAGEYLLYDVRLSLFFCFLWLNAIYRRSNSSQKSAPSSKRVSPPSSVQRAIHAPLPGSTCPLRRRSWG